ncbi:MAG: MarR family transcriptional regulator [Candidatus Aenigmarchaeota archaeon]|nr:MarR family transcriptional regulator [Candidatus Aenigmarchaeota archaeon]
MISEELNPTNHLDLDKAQEDISKEARDDLFNLKDKLIFMKLLRLFLFLLFIKITVAAEIQVYSVIFDIQPDMSVKQEIKIVFAEPLEERNLSYILTGHAYDFKANNTFEEIKIKKTGDSIVLLIPNGTRQLYLSFETKDLIKNYNDGKEFLTYLYLPEAKISKFKLLLPKGYVLYKEGVIPKGKIETDGERIFVVWENLPFETPIIVRFYQTSQNKLELLLAFALIVIALIIWLKIRKDESYLLGFSNDEIKVINVLKEKRVIYQNKLEKELGFSRAKMTRIIKKLEDKGLVEKEKIGRTNKLKWK